MSQLLELPSAPRALVTDDLPRDDGAVRPRPVGVGVGVGAAWWTLVAIGALGACGLAAVVGSVIVNGDSVWHLVWGRALADGTLDTFRTGPTPHPSLLGLGAATSLLGDAASYVVSYVLFGPLAFGALVAATYDVARRLSSPWAATAAVLILTTSVGVVSLASSARYDIAFAALVMTAIALEMARPRRGVAPLVCLAAAGLIRPEAWVLAGLYWLFLAPRLSWPARLRTAALVAVAPAVWMSMDLAVMGDPLYSLHATDDASEVLYGQYTPWENLEVGWRNLVWYLGVVPLILLAPATVLLVRDRPRGAPVLLGTLAVTLGIFVLLVSRGMASNERYLLVPVCVLAILAAMALDGGGRRTRPRVVLGVLFAVLLSLQAATHIDAYGTVAERAANGRGYDQSARALVGMPGVRDALRRCPAVSVPTGKMRHWFAFRSGRAPEAFVSDSKGRTRPDVYIAPGNPAVTEMALTRPRFDDDASFRVPPGLEPGPRNADWILYVAPGSACAARLR
jgi:hypothetical protein